MLIITLIILAVVVTVFNCIAVVRSKRFREQGDYNKAIENNLNTAKVNIIIAFILIMVRIVIEAIMRAGIV